MESDLPPRKNDGGNSEPDPEHPAEALDAYDSTKDGETVMYNRSRPTAWVSADYGDVIELRGMR